MNLLRKEIDKLKVKLNYVSKRKEENKVDESSVTYKRGVKIEPTKLEKGMDYRIWLEGFQLYAGRFDFKKAFQNS